MAYEGSLVETPFPAVLQRLARGADTGILTLQGKEEIIGVTFLDGEVVSVDAVNQAPEDGLGHILEETGLVSQDEFTTLVAENQAGGGRVIDLLVERGYINRQQLLDSLRQQTLRLCSEACAWEEGQFRFYRGDQVSYEHGIEPLNVDDLLARLAGGGERAEAAPDLLEEIAAEEPPKIQRLEDMEDEVPAIDILDLQPLTPSAVQMPRMTPLTPLSVEMPDETSWEEGDGDEVGFEPLAPPSKPWYDLDIDWQRVVVPLLPGRLMGVGMLVSLAALMILAPERFLVPLEGQERIRTAVAGGVQGALYSKIDQAAKTFFLLRGAFPTTLDGLVDLDLLAASDTRLSRDRELSYTAAPVSYLLAIEGEARVEGSIQTETIGGNFLLDPDFSPPELVDTPPLVLLD